MQASHEQIRKDNPTPKSVAQTISNSKALKNDVQTAATKILKLKEERKAINSKIKSVRDDLESKGMDKRAFDHVLAYFERNLSQRDGYDSSVELAHEALQELEGDLFSRKKDE